MLLLCNNSLYAKTELAEVFGDNMVLQAGEPIEIWGTGRALESVDVTLGSATRHCAADVTGQWSVSFPPRSASREPIEILVEGKQTVRVTNVLIGEVWIAAGQSNMEWPLNATSNAARAFEGADLPDLRLCQLHGAAHTNAGTYTSDQMARLAPRSFLNGAWQCCNKESAGPFSAVGYFFAKRLHEELQMPVGIVCPAVGGTPTESWIRRDAMKSSKQLSELVEGHWLDNQNLGEWCRTRAKQNLGWNEANGSRLLGDNLGPYHPFQPGYMWEAGVAPLCRLRVRGVIWYQGESNAESAALALQQRELLTALISDWRSEFRSPALPFLFVQLPALGRPHWPPFRQSQLECARAVGNTGMVVTIDLGHPSNVHPPDKQPIGDRLANLALGQVYKLPQRQSWSFPVAAMATLKRHEARVNFEGAEGGLISRDGGPIRHFEIAGLDGKFVPATARLETTSVLVGSDAVDSPRYVRYAWKPYPSPGVNLFSTSGLPASPFEIQVQQE